VRQIKLAIRQLLGAHKCNVSYHIVWYLGINILYNGVQWLTGEYQLQHLLMLKLILRRSVERWPLVNVLCIYSCCCRCLP